MERVASDAELVQASRRGERDAFGRLIERYQNLVGAVSYGATGDRALSEDVAQETFLCAWRQLDQVREPAQVRSWLCGIARNLGRKASRRSRREVPAADRAELDQAAAEPSPLEVTLEAESERIVRAALERMPERYREALILYYQQGRSARDVADQLGISEEAALQRLSRGRRYLHDGVTSVVERTLAGHGRRPGLAARVLAALPPTAALPHASTPKTGGTSMWKIAALAAAAAAAGGGAIYLGTRTGADAAPAPAPAIAPADERAPAAPPEAARATSTARVRSERPTLAAPGGGTEMIEAPEPDAQPRADGATLARLGLDRGPARGPANAPVTLIVFTDFMCDYCGKVLGTIDQLWDEYPTKLRLVIKQFPVHPEAELAAEAALAANAQGKFWELHDLMLANQDEDLGRDALLHYGEQAGLDLPRLRRALDERSYRDARLAEQSAGKELGVQGTPAFLINGRLIVGARPIDEFRAMIEEELARIATAPATAR